MLVENFSEVRRQNRVGRTTPEDDPLVKARKALRAGWEAAHPTPFSRDITVQAFSGAYPGEIASREVSDRLSLYQSRHPDYAGQYDAELNALTEKVRREVADANNVTVESIRVFGRIGRRESQVKS